MASLLSAVMTPKRSLKCACPNAKKTSLWCTVGNWEGRAFASTRGERH